MFQISLIVVAVLFLVWGALIYVRKTMWDAVHRNLLDLVDNYSGKVIRNGFAARPVFHGQVNNNDLTINFSSAKSVKGRESYIDFTFTQASEITVTIAEMEWLKQQNDDGEMPTGMRLQLQDDLIYMVMPGDNRKLERLAKKPGFRRALGRFSNLAYFFVGKSGTICEFRAKDLPRETEFDKMRERIQNIQLMLSELQ